MLLTHLKHIADMVMSMIRTYTELSKLKTFEERFEYLKLDGNVGVETFGYDRYLNQIFYKDPRWLEARDNVIIRDLGCDLGCVDREIPNGVKILVHHMNPITKEQILARDPILFDEEYLISTTKNTHDAIHYSDESILITAPQERTPNDTCPWKTIREEDSYGSKHSYQRR